MALDKNTRNLLSKTVTACRRRSSEDVTVYLRANPQFQSAADPRNLRDVRAGNLRDVREENA